MKLKPSFLVGSFLMLLSKFFERGVGLFSTIILARLLVPEDFGVVAISMLFVYVIEVLGKSGINEYIIRKDNVSDEDLNSAWTLNVILKSFVALVGIAFSRLVADFFGDERLTAVICVMLIIAPISSLANPKLILYIRNQDYRIETLLAIIKKFSSVICVLLIAYYYKSYWAIVSGSLVAAIIGLIASYIVSPYLPKLTLSKFSHQWSFTKWAFLKEIVIYLRNQIDSFFVSKVYSVDVFGGYHVAKYLGTMPSSQISEPLLTPLLAEFSKSRNDKNKLINKFRITIFMVLFLTIPVCLYGYCKSEAIVGFVLGEKWIGFSEVFSLFILTCVSIEIQRVSTFLLISLNLVKIVFYISLFSLLVLVSCYFYFINLSLDEFVFYKFLLDLALSILCFVYSLHSLNSLKKVILIAPMILIVILSSFVSLKISGGFYFKVFDSGFLFIFNILYNFTVYIVSYFSLTLTVVVLLRYVLKIFDMKIFELETIFEYMIKFYNFSFLRRI